MPIMELVMFPAEMSSPDEKLIFHFSDKLKSPEILTAWVILVLPPDFR